MGKIVEMDKIVEAEAEVVETTDPNTLRPSMPPTPYYEVKAISKNSIVEFGNEMEDAINAGNQILQMGVVGDNHYALVVVERKA